MGMGRILLLLSAVACAARGGELTTITIANGDWPPYMGKTLPAGGPVSKLTEEAFAAEGIRVVYQYMPWRRGLEETRRGRFDGALGWAHTPDRDADFLFTDAVMTTHIVLFHPKAKPIAWQNLQDLAPYRLGGVAGFTYGEEFDRLVSAGTLKLELSTADDINLRKIAVRHLDASPIDREVGLYYLATSLQAFADRVAYNPKEIGEAPHYLLIPKGSPQRAELVERFNRGLAKLRASGQLAGLESSPAAQ